MNGVFHGGNSHDAEQSDAREAGLHADLDG
jgi:hypothetical protein